MANSAKLPAKRRVPSPRHVRVLPTEAKHLLTGLLRPLRPRPLRYRPCPWPRRWILTPRCGGPAHFAFQSRLRAGFRPELEWKPQRVRHLGAVAQHQSQQDFRGYILGHAWRQAMPRKCRFRNGKGAFAYQSIRRALLHSIPTKLFAPGFIFTHPSFPQYLFKGGQFAPFGACAIFDPSL